MAIDRFKKLATEVVAELEAAIARGDSRYFNAEIALRNVRNWLTLANAGTLPGSYRPCFGIGKSDLMFGPVEERMYELELLYVDRIMDSQLHVP